MISYEKMLQYGLLGCELTRMRLEALGLVLLAGAIIFWWLRMRLQKCGGTQMNGGPCDSSESTNLNTKFDVFLNHRGPDTKRTFVSILHDALQHVGCESFLDAKSLVEGERAFKSINDALSGALVHVAIFSPKYAESRYCLDELCDILSSKKPVIVVFYNVEPENLRRTDEGPYARAFKKHLKSGRFEEVKRWKDALLEAASITGFKHVDCIDDIVKLKEEVVARILSVLPPPLGSPIAQHRVGISESLNFLLEKLHGMGEYPGAIGIYGMGGIGKTTLACEIYYQERRSFNNHYFLKNAKEYEGKAIEDLQMRLVSSLFRMDKRISRELWFNMIMKKKVFLVIDDVRDTKQFHELLPSPEKLALGSRVIITSRDCSILQSIMRDLPQPQQLLYLVPELSISESLELFIWHAFRKKSLDEVDIILHDSVKEIVKACKGVPLAIEVMGGYMWDTSENQKRDCWTKAKFLLQSNIDIMRNLQFSYDGLGSNKLKKMFLDIACCMVGNPKYIALEVWKSNGYIEPEDELSTLVNKCLIKIDDTGLLRIHDLLRDMGRHIVEEASIEIGMSKRPSYIWNTCQAVRTLQKRQGEGVVALSLVEGCNTILQANSLESFKDLTYLFLGNCKWHGEFSRWSNELRWLQWRYFPYEQLPKNLEFGSLVVLDLSNSYVLTQIWAANCMHKNSLAELKILILSKCYRLTMVSGEINYCRNLKCIDFQGCFSLRSLPRFLTELINLETFNLSRCNGLLELPIMHTLGKLKFLNMSKMNLSKLPEDFGQLLSLKEVNLKSCKNLMELPESFGNLYNLEDLDIGYCQQFQRLPSSFGDLKKLCFLDLTNTILHSLPENFGQLSSLKKVHFKHCKNLVEFPESFGNLCNLEDLDIGYCQQFQRLPSSFGDLKKLCFLDLTNTILHSLPENFGQLSSLKKVHFKYCKNLVEFPESFGNLCNLEDLDIGYCQQFQRLPSSFGDLKKLLFLDLSSTILHNLPENFGYLLSLKEVDFRYCKKLVEFPKSFGNLCNLEELHMEGCEQFYRLPSSFGDLKNLWFLNIRSTMLQGLPENFGHLSNLKFVDFRHCLNLVRFPESFGNLYNLEYLDIGDCQHFQKLPSSFGDLKNLWFLNLSSTILQDLPGNFGHLLSLKKVNFKNCKNLVKFPESFGSLLNLENLDMEGCDQFQKLPSSFGDLKKLLFLNLRYTILRDLPQNFGQLSSLKKVDFKYCKNLVEFPKSFGSLCNLKELHIGGCEHFHTLPSSFGDLKSLWFLDLGSTMLQGLPENFGHLSSLKLIDFRHCKNLVEFPESFGSLYNLEELYMGGCEHFDKLPSSFIDLKKLWFLDLSYRVSQDLSENFGYFLSLKLIDFRHCKKLIEFPKSFYGLCNLEELYMRGCEIFQRLPSSFGNFKKLWLLDLSYTMLQDLPKNFGHLSSLKKVYFRHCKYLAEFPESFGSLCNLEELYMGHCEQFKRLPSSFGDLQKLSFLDLSYTMLEDLPQNFGHLSNLKLIDFRYCKNLVEFQEPFGGLYNLEELYMGGCENFYKLPSSLGNLKNLWFLDLSHTMVQNLPENFGQISSLKKIHFRYCKNLVEFPDSFGSLCNLEELYVGHCEHFYRLPSSFGNLQKLWLLDLSYSRLQDLPKNFGHLSNLELVYFRYCKNLVVVPESFGCLSKLEKLDMEGCEQIQRLPSSSGDLKKLTY